ncbi:hypothetical protein [Kitasatospora sp. CB02891]|uniref:hypothetical protein n=1 Tax=Kitasatospora sp. CB02891 TaxID=2020329 RepID=UPI0012FD14E5|nr:hypothetical protein [Kitasatospora sp. CB02891]
MTQPLDLAAIQALHHPTLDPATCGTCRRAVLDGRPVEHTQCARRAVLLPAPDAPDPEELADMTDEEKANLPARFHIPAWEGLAVPHSWVCAVCWGDGWTTAWPCKAALEHGESVFTPEHLAVRARETLPALIARIRELEQLVADHEAAQGPLPCSAPHPVIPHNWCQQPRDHNGPHESGSNTWPDMHLPRATSAAHDAR